MGTNDNLREGIHTYKIQWEGMMRAFDGLSDYLSTLESHAKTLDGIYEACRIMGSKVETPAIKLEQYEEVERCVERITMMIQHLGSAENHNYFGQLEDLSKRFAVFEEPKWKHFEKIAKSFESAVAAIRFEKVVPEIAHMRPEIIDAAKSFDFESVEVKKDSLVIHGVEYAHAELADEVEKQIEDVKSPEECLYADEAEKQIEEVKSPGERIYDKVEYYKRKYCVLIWLIYLLAFLPQVPQYFEFYKGAIDGIQTMIAECKEMCYTARENAKLKTEPLPKAPVIMTLPQYTPLEILESVPRWHHVKYVDQNQVEIRAWISKISVETEE